MLQEGTAPSPAGRKPGDEDLATAPIPALKAVQERDLPRDVFDLFPFGIMVVDRGGQSVAVNEALRELVALPGDPDAAPVTCCSLFGCKKSGVLADACLTELAISAGERLPEVRIDIPASATGAIWVTGAPLYADGSRVVFQVRPGDPRDRRARTTPHWMTGPRLRVLAMGPTRIEVGEGTLTGEWLEQRPGQLLKYLIAHRHRVVPVEEIAEALWANAGFATANTVRHFIHALREKLEPGRAKRARSSFVLARAGGYTIDPHYVRCDVDEYEEAVNSGMAALVNGEPAAAAERLERALALYRGDFLADEPYAEWAFAERERLRALVEKPLRGLAELRLRANDLDTAIGYMERLADMEPFDSGIQRQLITLLLAQGRRSRAIRQYQTFQMRVVRGFGEAPDFQLADLVVDPGSLHLI